MGMDLAIFSMPRSRAEIWRLVASCTGVAVCASAAMSCCYAAALGLSIPHLLAPGVVIPAVVAPLMSWSVGRHAVSLQMARAELERLAHTDALTGALNRRGFMEFAQRAFERRREERSVHLVLLDIDRFKAINDGHGHAAGDAAIAHAVALMREIFEPIDGRIGRCGGDELAILIVGVPASLVSAAAEGLRMATERRPVVYEEEFITMTISVGVAVMFDDDADLNAVLLRADRALYAAKSQGRNRVCASAPLRAA